MITIRYAPKGVSLTARGHAGSAPYGRDLVCAGVTVLLRTLAANLRGKPDARILLEPGRACISARPERETRIQFETVFAGLVLLAGEFPQYITIRKEDA